METLRSLCGFYMLAHRVQQQIIDVGGTVPDSIRRVFYNLREVGGLTTERVKHLIDATQTFVTAGIVPIPPDPIASKKLDDHFFARASDDFEVELPLVTDDQLEFAQRGALELLMDPARLVEKLEPQERKKLGYADAAGGGTGSVVRRRGRAITTSMVDEVVDAHLARLRLCDASDRLASRQQNSTKPRKTRESSQHTESGVGSRQFWKDGT
jgi:hypothetical protein